MEPFATKRRCFVSHSYDNHAPKRKQHHAARQTELLLINDALQTRRGCLSSDSYGKKLSRNQQVARARYALYITYPETTKRSRLYPRPDKLDSQTIGYRDVFSCFSVLCINCVTIFKTVKTENKQLTKRNNKWNGAQRSEHDRMQLVSLQTLFCVGRRIRG